MRNISFAKTIEQVRARQKTVTRRRGWAWLTPGTLLRPVKKTMGLKKGEKVQPIFDDDTCIRVVSVNREQLWEIIKRPDDPAKEGFVGFSTDDFVDYFTFELGALPTGEVTRIEFEYVTSIPAIEEGV